METTTQIFHSVSVPLKNSNAKTRLLAPAAMSLDIIILPRLNRSTNTPANGEIMIPGNITDIDISAKLVTEPVL
jgi:hypothetical protein